MILGRIYSGNAPGGSKLGLRARAFIDRVCKLGLLSKGTPPGTRTEMPYPKSALFRSVALQLSVELKKHYRNGSNELKKKMKKNKGRVTDSM
ncbi:hypothetical protein BG011_001048, partial [Mortierella polycephala]